MAIASKNKTPAKQNGDDLTRDFDGEGVHRALLAALEYVYEHFPQVTLPQFLVSLEVMIAEKDGNPHTLVTLVKKLNMPFSTASRVVWSLTKEGGDVGVIKYERHPTDRRKKYLIVDPNVLDSEVPRALLQAMVAYYGESVYGLHRSAS